MILKIALNLFIFFVLFSITKCQVNEGDPVKENELNFLVNVLVIGKNKARANSGGTVINSKWILTCRHTLEHTDEFEPQKIRIVAGTKTLPKLNQQFEIGTQVKKNIMVSYEENVFLHDNADAALIYLGNDPLILNDGRTYKLVESADLISRTQKLPEVGLTSGWGRSNKQGKDVERTNHALKANIRVTDCPMNHRAYPGTTFCYQAEQQWKFQLSDKGDSGSPLTFEIEGKKEVVAGLVQGACSTNPRTNVNVQCRGTDVSKLLDWIEKLTGEDSRKDKNKKMEVLGAFVMAAICVFFL